MRRSICVANVAASSGSTIALRSKVALTLVSRPMSASATLSTMTHHASGAVAET
jgi:hypothetical protein